MDTAIGTIPTLESLTHPELPRSVRFIWINGERWEHSYDVCKVLGFNNPRQAIHYHLLDNGKTQNPSVKKFYGRNKRGEMRQAWFLNRQGIIELSLYSKLAKENQKQLNRLLAALIEEKLREEEARRFGERITRQSPIELQQQRGTVIKTTNERSRTTKAMHEALGIKAEPKDYIIAASTVCKSVTGKLPQELKKELGHPWREVSTIPTMILTTIAEAEYIYQLELGNNAVEATKLVKAELSRKFSVLAPAIYRIDQEAFRKPELTKYPTDPINPSDQQQLCLGV